MTSTKKAALVTGASRGIGQATALALLSRGYEVHGTYLASENEARRLETEHSGLIFHQLDLASDESAERLLTQLRSIAFDGIVNSAGIFEMEGFDDFDWSAWQRVMRINLDGPMRISMGLRDQIRTGGAIVNVSSIDGMSGSFASMAYAASKSALINLTQSLANNFGRRGIRVNAVAPGWINEGPTNDERRLATEITPLGRSGRPDEVARVIAFLLGEESAFINGATIVIDGGFGNVSYPTLRYRLRPRKR